MKKADKRRLPQQVIGLRRNWRSLHRFWWMIHYFTGLVVVLGAFAAGSGFLIRIPYFKYVVSPMITGIVAAGFACVLIFLVPLRKSERYFGAFHMLDQAMLEFLQNRISTATLVDKSALARDIVLGGVKPRTTKTDAADQFPPDEDFNYEIPPSPR